MKKKPNKVDDDLLPEYNSELIRGGVQGKYLKRYQKGRKVTITGRVRETMKKTKVQYVTNGKGKNVAVIIPIDLWHEIQSERETAYLLGNPVMKRRLLKAIKNPKFVPFEEVREKLGI